MQLTKTELDQAYLKAIDKINIARGLKTGLVQHGDYYLQQAMILASIQLQLITNVYPDLLQEQLYTLTSIMLEKIEAAGASVPLTMASTFVSDLMSSIGNQYNPSSKERAKMVRDVLYQPNVMVR